MPGLSDHGRAARLAGFASAATFLAACAGDDGVGQAGARVPLSWSPPTEGRMVNAAQLRIVVPAGSVVEYLAYWSAASGGDLLGSMRVDREVFANGGVVVIGAGDLVEEQD